MSSQDSQDKFQNTKRETVASSSYNCSELLEALKAIQNAVHCYSCKKSLRSARMCLNGHGICWNCKNRSNRVCRLCGSFIMEAKLIMVNDIIKLLPRSCNFSNKGCESLVLANDADHETFCRYRATDCRIPDCGWKGMAKELLLHLEKYHGKDMIRTPSQDTILMSFNTRLDRVGIAVIVVFNNIFWRHVKVRQNILMQLFQYIPMEKPTKKYSVMISFHTPEANYSRVVPVHTDVFSPANLFKDQETFRLPRKIAISFNKFHSGVHHSFKIIQSNV